MSKLPKQVALRAAQADATLAATNAPVSEPAPAAPAPAQEPAATPAPAQVAEPAAATPSPAPVAPSAPAADSEQTWEQRYRSLQGVHNHHVQDLKQRVQQREAEAAALRAELEEAKRAKEAAPQPAQVDPNDAETFGADLVQMVIRVAETRFMGLAARLEARVTEVEQRLSGTTKAVAQTAEDVFLGRLRAAVPDYEAVNVEPGFLTWLAEIDPVYGRPRQAALTEAADALDSGRVANIFLAYKASLAPVAPPTPPVQRAASELERQVAPNSGAAAPQVRAEQVQTISSKFVEDFYRKLASGRYRGREDEALRIEADINRALAEGRIT